MQAFLPPSPRILSLDLDHCSPEKSIVNVSLPKLLRLQSQMLSSLRLQRLGCLSGLSAQMMRRRRMTLRKKLLRVWKRTDLHCQATYFPKSRYSERNPLG